MGGIEAEEDDVVMRKRIIATDEVSKYILQALD